MEIKVNPEYEKMLPKLWPEEHKALKESIKENGLYEPIVVNHETTVLDGHNRFKICKELGIEPKVVVKKFANLYEEKKYIIESHLKRRNLNDFQKAELGMLLLPIEEELAKQRREATLPEKGQKGFQPVSASDSANIDLGKSTTKVAEKIGLSPATFQRAVTIIEKAPEPMKSLVRAGATSISKAYGEIKKQEKRNVEPTKPVADIQKQALQNLEASIKSQFIALRGKFGDLIPHIKHPCEHCPAELMCATVLVEDEKFHESLPECMRKKLNKEA